MGNLLSRRTQGLSQGTLLVAKKWRLEIRCLELQVQVMAELWEKVFRRVIASHQVRLCFLGLNSFLGSRNVSHFIFNPVLAWGKSMILKKMETLLKLSVMSCLKPFLMFAVCDPGATGAALLDCDQMVVLWSAPLFWQKGGWDDQQRMRILVHLNPLDKGPRAPICHAWILPLMDKEEKGRRK